MDIQAAVVKILKDARPVLASIALAIETARTRNIPVIYVFLGFRKGFPEISPDNKSFSQLKKGTMNLDTEEAVRIDPAVAPRPGDIIVNKKRVSAFVGSDLEVVLRASGIRHLVLTGIATSGVVLSTLRAAADMDYVLTVLSDGCADADEEVHRVLTTKIYPRQAQVITVAEWGE
ncbi:MAG: isochorismatase [Fibrobacteres bacterium]|nr:isochorismatase [Fibrobacterota bacterium]